MKELDPTKITMAMFDLAKKMISGEEIKKVRYRVTLEVPEEIAHVLEEVSEQFEVSIQEILGKLASEGLDLRLKNSVDQIQGQFASKDVNDTLPAVDDLINQFKGSGFDLSGIVDQMEHLRTLAGDLQGLQKVVENAIPGETTDTGSPEGTSNIRKNQKDSS